LEAKKKLHGQVKPKTNQKTGKSGLRERWRRLQSSGNKQTKNSRKTISATSRNEKMTKRT